jgi:hypothetical protein
MTADVTYFGEPMVDVVVVADVAVVVVVTWESGVDVEVDPEPADG